MPTDPHEEESPEPGNPRLGRYVSTLAFDEAVRAFVPLPYRLPRR